MDIGFDQADYNIRSEDRKRQYNENQALQPRKAQALLHVPEDLVLEIDSDREEEKVVTHLPQLQSQLHPRIQPEAIRLGAGWYTLKELDDATNKFSDENVLGKGSNGIVYRGVLVDGTPIAIKNLLNNKGQAEEEFKAEVEVIGRVRHKHLVKLLGYCVEDECRMLVYEYVNNGNLDQWLHINVAEDVSPLTWNIRMHIILGVAKGLAYLHEGLEPKVVHRDVKANNILLTDNWVPKISDFGLAKHLGSGVSHVTTRVMGTFGYVAPEYACTGMLNERSDVYSFGVLIMEIISGRTPVDYRRPRDEIQLVEWLKDMIGERRYDEVLDPKMPIKPSRKALKRALLVALQCVDPDSHERPSMGNVVHMLEMDNILFCEEKGILERRLSSSSSLSNEKKSPDIYV